MSRLAGALGIAALVGVLAAPLVGQGQGPRQANRAELTAMLDSLEHALPQIDDDNRILAEMSVVALQRRLDEGDVWPGDVVTLRVAGEDRWTADFTVTPTRSIELESIEAVSLANVLHSELEESITLQLAKYLRDPLVQVEVLKRIGILGAVGNPGFFTVTGSILVSEAVMLAGGPGDNSNVDRIEFRRLGQPLPVGTRVVWESMSLDDLGVRSGDEMFVPTNPRSLGAFLLAALGLVATITLIAIRIW